MKRFVGLLIFALILSVMPMAPVDAAADATYQVSGNMNYEYSFQVLNLVNAQRAQYGVPALSMDADLLRAAAQRSAEIAILFAHERPDGSICFSVSGKNYGENCAIGQTSPEQVVNSWMNSPGHRENILDPEFTIIGIGCIIINGRHHWVQSFGFDAASPATMPASGVATFTVKVDEAYVKANGGDFSRATKVTASTATTPSVTAPSTTIPNPVTTPSITGTYPAGTMFRLYNKSTGEHFYTADARERDSLIRGGWAYEDVAWTAPTSGTSVYRLYNSSNGDHHYTTGTDERAMLIRAGWKDEGIGWYSKDGGKPMYRLFNPNARTGSHHYTLSAEERDLLVRGGWKYEGIGWYGM